MGHLSARHYEPRVFTISKVYSLYLRNFTSHFNRRCLETYISAFAANDLESLQRLYTELEKKIDVSRTSSVDELLSAINNTSRSLALEILVQRATPRNMDKACTVIRYSR